MSVHCCTDGHATPTAPSAAVSTATTAGSRRGRVERNLATGEISGGALTNRGAPMALIPTPGAFGPDRWPLPSIVTGAGIPGASGSKVTSRPMPSTAVHWSTVGQAIACNARAPSIVTGIGSPGRRDQTSVLGRLHRPPCTGPSTDTHRVQAARGRRRSEAIRIDDHRQRRLLREWVKVISA